MDRTRPGRTHLGNQIWPLLALNFFVADMQSGIGPFVSIFLLAHGWHSGLIGTALTLGNIAGMLVTTPFGALIDATRHKRLWVIVPGVAVVAGSALILLSQNFWIVSVSQVATAIAGAAIIPAITGLTLGIVKQKGFNRQNGKNQAFNHAGNLVGAAISGYLGWKFGYSWVFLLAALFGVISIACVLFIPDKMIDHHAARGNREDDPQSQPNAFHVLLKHKPMLVLALSLALFQLGNAYIVGLYGLSAVASADTNGPGFVATTIVITQGVMIFVALVGMQTIERVGFWPVLLISFSALPIRGLVAYFFSGWSGVIPVQVLDGIGAGLQSVAVPGFVAHSLRGTGRVNLGQGAVITVQGLGASVSPLLGGWCAQYFGYQPTFLVLGCVGLLAVAMSVAFRNIAAKA